MVECFVANEDVAGSSPAARSAQIVLDLTGLPKQINPFCPYRLVARTPGFQSGKEGSEPSRGIS